MTATYDQELTETLKDHPIYGNNGNGNTKEKEEAETTTSRISQPKKRRIKNCVLCGSLSTYVRSDGRSQWHRSKDPKKQGYLCNRCYVQKNRARRQKLSTKKDMQLAPIFERQIALLRQQQAKIKDQYLALEKEKKALFVRLEGLTVSLRKV